MRIAELKKLKPGTKLKLSKHYLRFYQKDAFQMNTVRNVIEERHADGFFIMKSIGEGLPYTVELIRLEDDVEGDSTPVPGAYVRTTVGSVSTCSYVSHKNLNKAS